MFSCIEGVEKKLQSDWQIYYLFGVMVGLGGLCQWAGILEATTKDGDWISSSGRQAERVVFLHGTGTSCQCNGIGFTRTHTDHGNYKIMFFEIPISFLLMVLKYSNRWSFAEPQITNFADNRCNDQKMNKAEYRNMSKQMYLHFSVILGQIVAIWPG